MRSVEEELAKTVRQNVKIGFLVKGRVEVLAGVGEKDWVIIEGQHYVSPGSEVYARISQSGETTQGH